MSNLPDLMHAIGTSNPTSVAGSSAGNHGVSREDGLGDASSQAVTHRFNKLHSDVRPYAMMTRTCYMQFDPMKDRGLLPSIFARSIGPVIGRTVFLQDVKLNQIQVAVERDKSEIYFTHGWSRLRALYNIVSGAWITLLYISPFVFHMKIRDLAGDEINYPVKNPPFRLLLNIDFRSCSWDGPIPFFVLPTKFSHRLEKTLTSTDVTTGSLTLFWKGFCQLALPCQDFQLTIIDWMGNEWKGCQYKLDSNPRIKCRISGQGKDICKFHRLAEGVVVKFGVTAASNNKIIYFKPSPFIGVRTTLSAPSTSGDKKVFYQNQHYFML